MKETFLSARALGLHVALLAWLVMCGAAAYWQFGRAAEGNQLSFLYAIEWPCFAIMGFFGWWALLHMEKVTEHQEQARRDYEALMRAKAAEARLAAEQQHAEAEDPALAAYNDHLAALSQRDINNRGDH